MEEEFTVTEIEYAAFAKCTNLKEIVIPGSVTTIGDSAFMNCGKLTSIASNAFSSSKQLTISGYTGSYAEEFATANSIAFSSVGAAPISLEGAQITVLDTPCYYDGLENTPDVEVRVNGKLVPNNGYSISYYDNVDIGTATVTITGIEKNGYRDTVEATFEIMIDTPELKSVTQNTYGVVVKWDEVPGAAEYDVYRKTVGGEYVYIGYTYTTEFLDDNIEKGTKYTYTVKAYGDSYWDRSEYDETGISITTAKDYYSVKFTQMVVQ